MDEPVGGMWERAEARAGREGLGRRRWWIPVRWHWAPGRVFLYEHGLLFAGRHYGWGELDAVQMGLERAEELDTEHGGTVVRDTVAGTWRFADGRSLTLRLRETPAMIPEDVAAFVWEQVTPGHRERAVEALRAGGQAEFGSIAATPTSLRVGDDTASWAQVRSIDLELVRVGPELLQATVVAPVETPAGPRQMSTPQAEVTNWRALMDLWEQGAFPTAAP